MTPPLIPRPDRPMEPTATAETTSTQLFGVLYTTLTGLVDSMVPNSGPWSLLRQSHPFYDGLYRQLGCTPSRPNASNYAWLPDGKHLVNKDRFGDVFLLNTDLIVACSWVNLGEDGGAAQGIEEVVNE
ncbi:hypothetical protein DSO57_1039256, partial [Entomophthora muscae]